MKEGVRLIGITGGIGAGKSVVCRILSLRGYLVYDCDIRAKELMCLEPLASGLKEIIGEEAFCDDGSLNRAYISSRLFSDNSIREKVNSLVHAAVRKDVINVASSSDLKDNLMFVESAIISSSGLARMMEKIWCVEAPKEVRLKRVLMRNPELSPEDVMKRIAIQEAEYENIEKHKATVLFNDNGSSLLLQIDGRIAALLC